MRNTEFDFTKLSIAERIELAEDLWDSIPSEGADLTLTEAQKAELIGALRISNAILLPESPGRRLYDRLKRGE